jgi:polyisoprenoid-binding protein YceI
VRSGAVRLDDLDRLPHESSARWPEMAAVPSPGRWASRVEFRVRQFWNAITVRGWFDQVEGEGTTGPDGKVTRQLVIVAASLNTKNKQRDKHLRSAASSTRTCTKVVLTVRRAALTADGRRTAEGTLEAGHR